MSLKQVIAIVGPTASGKTAAGVNLALEFDGEIINCDSVQVYRDVEIATAKPTPAEMRGVTHHLLDFLPANQPYTAADWARDARRVINDIQTRRRLPIIVGGTGFYLRALYQPLFESLPTNEDLRLKLKGLRERRGAQHLHKILTRVDSVTAARLAPRDWARVQRALEYYFQHKRKLSEARNQTTASRQEKETPDFCRALHVFALRPPRDELYRRINARTVRHFQGGLIEEVERLLARGIAPASTALGAHGYRRAVEYLRGERTLESAIEQTQQDVRRYAKRQLTWFRREPNVEWIDGFGDAPETAARLSERIAESIAACAATNVLH